LSEQDIVITKDELKLMKLNIDTVKKTMKDNNVIFVFECGHLPILDSDSKKCAGCVTEDHFKLMGEMGIKY
jgi:hypothetical protein|tara:strand:+ start:636 stop:848 length:213 start_codon:yes stop_codon:yes gene_type:complete